MFADLRSFCTATSDSLSPASSPWRSASSFSLVLPLSLRSRLASVSSRFFFRISSCLLSFCSSSKICFTVPALPPWVSPALLSSPRLSHSFLISCRRLSEVSACAPMAALKPRVFDLNSFPPE